MFLIESFPVREKGGEFTKHLESISEWYKSCCNWPEQLVYSRVVTEILKPLGGHSVDAFLCV